MVETTDPYITIIDGVTDLGDLAAGEAVANSDDPFSFEVAADAPVGRLVELSVRATFTGGETLSSIVLCIGKFNYLVWDPTSDRSSGPVIAATLERLHYSGTIRTTLPVDDLDAYATLWVSLGMYAENYVVGAGDPEGPAIVGYMANGGNVYLEGGDVWAFDPLVGGFDFCPHFAIAGTSDGSADLLHVLGVQGEFTEEMDFLYTGENSFVDHLSPGGNGFAILSNSSPVYYCGIAADEGSHRTVGTSFELGGLEDGALPSTKETLARAIMSFFGVDPQGDLFADGFECSDCSAWSVTVP